MISNNSEGHVLWETTQMSRPAALPSEKSEPDRCHGFGGALKLTTDSSIEKAAKTIDPEISIYESTGLTPSKRQRNRKLSNPQKRLKYTDTCHSPEDAQDVSMTTLSEEQQAEVYNNQTWLTSSQDEHTSLDPTLAEDGQGQAGKGSDDVVGGIKTETVHGFIVDQWYDLGPSRHKDGHSPVPLDSSEVHKLENKDATDDEIDLVNTQTDHGLNCGTVWGMRPPSQNFNQKSGANNGQTEQVGQVDFFRNSDKVSAASQQNLAADSRPGANFVDTNHAQPFLVPSSFLRCPLPGSSSAFSFHPHALSLPLHVASSPYFSTPASVNHESICNTFTVSPNGIYSYVTNMSLTKPAEAYSYIRIEPDHAGAKQSLESKAACMFEPNSPHGAASAVNTTPITPATSTYVPATLEPAQTSSIDTSFFATGYPRSPEGALYTGLPFFNSLYQNGPFDTSGLVLVPSGPFYVQRVPYMPVLPSVNYSRSQAAVSSSAAIVQTGFPSPSEDRSKGNPTVETPTPTQAPHSGKVPSPQVSTTSLADSRPDPGDDHYTRSLTSTQQSRPKVKSKLAASADFIDPTRIKFGVDDIDTDEDVSQLNDGSDCSDKEWQPNKRHEKATGGWPDSSSDDVAWKAAGLNESDSPIKRTHARRQKRPSKEPAQCAECGKVFQGIYYLRRHQMSHSDIRPYQCDMCQKSFKQKAHLIGHLTVHDRALKQREASIKNPSPKAKPLIAAPKCPGRPKKTYTEKELACTECGKAFKTVYRLKRHELSHTDIRPFSCRICGKGFKQTGHRNEHEANHEKSKKRFLCNLCGVVFRSRSSFNNHMRSHGTEKLRLQAVKASVDELCAEGKAETGEVCHTGYDCPYCTEKFATAQALNNHLETHVEVQQRRHVQPYTCDVCRRTFTYRHNLIKHKLIHKAPDKFAQFYQEKIDAHVASGKPSFKCGLCSKVFIRKETLAKHFKIHSGNKPFKCLICSREFTQNVHLKVHMRKHTGSRPFQCKECGRSFIDSTALAKHIEYEACNSDNCLYYCKICDKLHYYMGSLKQHIRKKHSVKEEDVETYILRSERSNKRKITPHGEKHPCKVCLSTFSEKCNLVRHIKRKHAGLVELMQKDMGIEIGNNLDDGATQNEGGERCTGDEKSCDEGKLRGCDKNSDRSKGGDLNWSSSVLSQCTVANDVPPIVKIDLEEIVPGGSVAGGHLCGGSVSCLGDKTCDGSPAERGRVTSRSQRDGATSETSGSRDTDNPDLPCSPFTKQSGRNLTLNFHEEEEEASDVLLEGFRMTDLPLSDHHLGQLSSQKYIHCKDDCCSDTPSSRCLPSDSDFLLQRDLRASLSKESVEESPTLPADISFLYNIGLIVSNRAKSTQDPLNKQKLNSRGSNFNTNSYCPQDRPYTSVGKNTRLHCHIEDSQTRLDCHREDSQTRLDCHREEDSQTRLNGHREEDSQFSGIRHKILLSDSDCFRSGCYVSTGTSAINGSDKSSMNTASKHGVKSNFSEEGDKGSAPSYCVPGAQADQKSKPDIKEQYKLTGDYKRPAESVLQFGEDKTHIIIKCCSPNNANLSPSVYPGDKTCCMPSGLANTHANQTCGVTGSSVSPGQHDVNTSAESRLFAANSKSTVADLSINTADSKLTTAATKLSIADSGLIVTGPVLNTADSRSNTVDTKVMITDSRLNAVKLELTASDSRLVSDATPLTDLPRGMTLCSKARKHIRATRRDKRKQNKEDNSEQTSIMDESVHSGPVTCGSPTALTRQHGSGDCPSGPKTNGLVALSGSASRTLDLVQVEQSLGTTSKLYFSSKAIEKAQAKLTSPEHLSSSSGDLQHLTQTKSVARPSPLAASFSLDIIRQTLPAELTVTDLSTAQNDAYLNVKQMLTGNVIEQTKGTDLSDPPESTKHRSPSPTERPHCHHSDCLLNTSQRSTQPTKEPASNVTTADSSRNDYEACPSESHLKYLGLLACKDAQAIKNKTIPLKDLYETYKPWLEDLVHKTRPRRNKSHRVNTTRMDNDHKSSTVDSTSIEIQIELPSSSDYTNCNEKRRISTFQERAESHASAGKDNTRHAPVEPNASAGKDNTRHAPVEPSILKRRRRFLKEVTLPDQEMPNERLAQEVTTVDLGDSRDGGHYGIGSSPHDRRLLGAVSSSLASSTTQNDASKPMPTTIATRASSSSSSNAEAGQRATAYMSPPTTPDSTVKGRQLYSCEVCGKYFTARHQLKRHEMSHTNHRPYNCEQCGRGFRQKVHLSDHVKRHQGQRPFVCAGCGKRFVLKNEMNQHFKNHCRATVDVPRGTPLAGDKPIFCIPAIELDCLSSTSEPPAVTPLEDKDVVVNLT